MINNYCLIISMCPRHLNLTPNFLRRISATHFKNKKWFHQIINEAEVVRIKKIMKIETHCALKNLAMCLQLKFPYTQP